MKKISLVLLVLAAFSSITFAQSNINQEDSLGVQGYDLVAYFSDSAIQGSAEFSHEYEGITYHFSTAVNLAVFTQQPTQYLPEYGGWCSYAMLEGEKVAINPKSYKIINGKLYLFYNKLFANTLKRWNKLADNQPEVELVTAADQQWQNILGE